MKHPIQPLIKDEQGVIRFQKNKIVEYLLDEGPFDMNDIARIGFSENDQEQFAQLIGYSYSGFGELSYVSNDTYDTAELMMQGRSERIAGNTMMRKKLKKARKLIKKLTVLLFHIHPDDLKL